MKCECCQVDIPEGDAREHLGRTLCEDCCMDALSPMKTCDPWAVHSAKSFEKNMGGTATLNPLQAEIIDILEKTGGVEPGELLTRLGGKLTEEEMMREFSALRHMEKARAEMRGDRKYFRLW